MAEDDRGPWWTNDPELIEIRRRTVEELDRDLDQRQPGPPPAPDPVVADLLGGASTSEIQRLIIGGALVCEAKKRS